MVDTKNIRFILFTSFASIFLLIFSEIVFKNESFFNFTNEINLKILVMFLLAEPHFAMTIPLLYGYRNEFKKKPLHYIYLPLIIIITALFLFYFNIIVFSILFLMFNVFHVNRQSKGFLILQGGVKKYTADIYEYLLHISVVLFFIIHFYLMEYKYIFLFFIIITLIISSIYFYKVLEKKNLNFKALLVYTQGFLVFLPISLFNDLLLAFAIGISIHYIQYLFISWPVCKKSFKFSTFYLIGFLMIYSLLSTSALSGILSDEKVSLFIFIPTVLQLLHFYYDGLIWKRSNPIIQETLKKASI